MKATMLMYRCSINRTPLADYNTPTAPTQNASSVLRCDLVTGEFLDHFFGAEEEDIS